MSLSIFNAVPAGAIEVLSDENGALHFKRADLGRFLGIVDMRHNFKNIAAKSRSEMSKPGGVGAPSRSGMYGGGENPHDAFVDLEAALEIVVRSRKPKAVELTKWLTRKGVEKVMEEHQKAIEEKQRAIDEKDMHIALLDDDLTESQDLVRQLEFSNTGMQGEIRAKDQEIHRRREEVQDLVANRHVPRRQGIDNVLCFVDKKSNDKHQFYVIRCQRKALETHKRCLRNRYPDMVILEECDDANAVHRWCRFKGETIEDFHRNHFNLDEEGRELFETAFDVAL